MSVVDTWDWDKLNPKEFEEPFEIDIHEKIHLMMYDFAHRFGVHPNKINMGSNLVKELYGLFFRDYTLKEDYDENGIVGRYEGIPVVVNRSDPDILEVGYMMKWIEDK